MTESAFIGEILLILGTLLSCDVTLLSFLKSFTRDLDNVGRAGIYDILQAN